MKIILKKGGNFAISVEFLLHLLEMQKKEVNDLFFYQQKFENDKVKYYKLDKNSELLKTVNPNIHSYIMITSKDFGSSFESEFCYSVSGYSLNSKTDLDKHENMEYFHTPEYLFYEYFIKDNPSWRHDEELIQLIEESFKNHKITEYFNLHKLKVVDVPDDVDWIITHDDYGSGEYVKENIEVRTWH